MRRFIAFGLVALVAAALAAAAQAGSHAAGPKPAPHRSLLIGGRAITASGGRQGDASVPGTGARPQVLSPAAYGALQQAMRKPRSQSSATPASGPAHSSLAQLTGSAATAHGHAYWNGTSWVRPAGASNATTLSTPRLLIPRSPGGQGAVHHEFPSTFFGSTQVDSATSSCSNPQPNEPSVAQSSDNPNDIVVAAQAYVDATGACDDSHAWVFYSHDGGQHWKEEVIPGTTSGLASGDVGVVYDAKDHVFVYSFLQFSRTTSTDSVNAESSSDGATWSDFITLDSNPGALDKVMITVNQDASSTNYGRVLVAWRDDHIGQNAFIDAFTDDGGALWTGSSDSINIVPDCGNGVSPAFDANGDAMAAWWDCNGGSNEEEQLSTNGGASWAQPSNTVISGVTDIGSSGPGGNCALNNGGSSFRCNSFPSLAGDPNSGDAGGTAFFVVFANWESTTQSSVTANVSQLHGLSTTDGGTTWNGGGGFAFNYMAFKDFGDKFFPWAGFAPNGRLNVGYSNREASASTGNPNGLSFNEGQAEASSLTSLRADSYIAYTADGTLGNPGSMTFIGDYSGIESQDNNFDTFPVWTDLRNGTLDVRTMDLCYTDCPTFLAPETPLSVSRTSGSTFTDLYQFNTDSSFGGAGGDFWNAVGIRAGADGTSVDDDVGLWNSRYFSTRVAQSAFGPPINDYVLENDNSGHGPTQPYFVDVHSFSTFGGPYTVEWAHGHVALGTSFTDSMGTGNVLRVYDMLDSTGTTYHIGLRPAGGNSSNYRISVHLNGNGTYQGAPQESATSGNVAPGSQAFATVNTGGSPTGFDALVVQNNNGGSGSYTLYRDTAVPTGSVSIDGGAQSTSSTSLSLTLAASNPTAGDPVSDMALSVDGGAFGGFKAFSPTATVSIPATEGSHTVSVEFRNRAGGVSAPATATIYLVQSPPSVTGVSPATGPTGGGNTVTLTGTHFAPGATAKFSSSGSPLATTFVSATKLQVTAPASARGLVNIFVTTPAGTSPVTPNDQYTFFLTPAITGLSPNAGSTAGGNVVTITGSGFVSGATAKFTNSGSPLATTFVSDSQLQVVAPAHSAGTFNVFVTTPGGTSAITNNDLYSFGAPTVTSFSPASGITGTPVTINGTGFVPGATVTFHGLSSPSVTFGSGTQLKAVVPDGAVAGKISVSTPAGSGSSATSFTPTLSITGISPSFGPAGTSVTIDGVGFTSSSQVRFSGTSASSVTFVSSSQLRATAPVGGTTGPLTVTNTAAPTGTVQAAADYAYAAPSVSSFSPGSGITGSQVTINGTNFVPGATVKFGSLSSPSVTFVSPAQLTAIVPNGATTATISVTAPAGTGTSAASFTPTLSITSFSPASGPAGTTVTINGIGFNSGSTVKFNRISASSVGFVSSSQLTATVPAGSTTGPITVTNTTAPTGTVASASSF